MAPAIIAAVSAIASRVANSLFPDPADQLKRDEAESKTQIAVLQEVGALQKAASDIIKTEAASQHWLAANWRPITALTFVGLVVARWLGWTAPGMTEPEYLAVYDIIQVMIGGYVISRGAEKVLPKLMKK